MPSTLRLIQACALSVALVALPLAAHSQSKPAAPQKPQDTAVYDGVPVANKTVAKKLKSLDNVYLIGHRNVAKGLDFYSQAKEIALGQQLAAQVIANSKVITDPVVNEYINRLAQNLVRNSDAKVPFTVHVLQDDTLNAFALPGGFFFVNSGIILGMKEEDELAGVMCHEIAHVAARHGTRNASRDELLQLLTIPAEIIAGPGLTGLGVSEGANVLLPLQFERFSRGDEQEADWLGIQYLWKSGYDPQGLVRAFETLEAEEKQKPSLAARMFASHPQTPDRIALSEKEIHTILPPRPEYVVTTSEFNQVQARLRALLKSKVETGVRIPSGGAPPGLGSAPPSQPPPPPVIKP